MNLKQDNSFNYRRQDNREDYNRFFKKKDQNNKSTNKKIVPQFNIEQQSFPVLLNKSQSNVKASDISNGQTFAKMAALPKIIEIDVEEVKPGHLSIQYDKQRRTITNTYGPKTPNFIVYENKENAKNSLHYRMNKAIYDININQQKRIQYYDEIHGEGSYDEMFNRPVYGSEYDTDENDEMPSDDSETE